MSYTRYVARPAGNLTEKPFSSAEEAWFWCCRIAMGVDGDVNHKKVFIRPCEANDLYIILRRLRVEGELRAAHFRVMIKYGNRQERPERFFGSSREECSRWDEAMAAIEVRLREKGLVEGHDKVR